MVARVIGASAVRLLDISRRGVLLETQTRLRFGAKATIHFTTCDASISVRALVVRSLVAGLGEFVVYHTALTFDEDLHLADVLAHQQPGAADTAEAAVAAAPITPMTALDGASSLDPMDASDAADAPDEEILPDDEMLNLLVAVEEDFESLQRRADAHGD